MPRIVVAVQDLDHWDAVLPVLPWLKRAGVKVYAHDIHFFPPRRRLANLATSLDLRPPKVSWTRRLGAATEQLMVGTTDDLQLLLAHQPRGCFLALPRPPVPAVVVGRPVPTRLQSLAAESPQSPAGQLLDGEHLGALFPSLQGLPYIMTGVPELDRETGGDPSGSIVLIHDWDLEATNARQRQGLLKQAHTLEALLVPLVPTGLRIEIRSAGQPLELREAETLQQLINWIRDRRNLPGGRIGLLPYPAWSNLSKAEAVLVLSPSCLMMALASGVERVWWLPFALPPAGPPPTIPQCVQSCTLEDEERFAHWVFESGWRNGAEEPAAMAALLRSLADGQAGERVAQTILAALEI